MSLPSAQRCGAPAHHRALSALLLTLLVTLLAALCSPSSSSAQDLVAPPDFFGVNVSSYQSDDYARMVTGNVGVARNVVPLGLLKQGRNKPYYWGYTDPIVRGTAEQGIDLIQMVYGAAPWVSQDLNQTVVKGQSAKAYNDLLIALVQRYGPGGQFWAENPYVPYRPVETWQIWNEPNSITWWGPKPKPSEYAKVLVRSANTIHSLDPNAQVLTAGIVARPTNSHAIAGKKFLSELFKYPGVTEAVDGVAYHPYSPSVNGVRKQLRTARKALNHRGASALPIWVTEIGWGSKGPKDLPLVKSEAGQNRVMRQVFEMVLEERERLGIQRLLWYHWRDGPDTLCKWCQTSGLLNKRSQPKQLFSTFQSIATR